MSDQPAQDQIADDVPPDVDPAQIERALFELRSQQHLIGGTVAGFVAAAVGAATWAGVTIATGVQIGWMAVGIGFLVGFSMRAVGKGIDPIFGYLGAGLALFGCGAGNLCAVIGMLAKNQGIPFLDLATKLDLNDLTKLLIATFSPMDLLFYAIAAYEGYRLSFRELTDQDADTLLADQ